MSKTPIGLQTQSKPVARSKRMNYTPTESQEQRAVLSWAHKLKYDGRRLSELLIHIPNGGSRHMLEAVNLKRDGVRAGVPDLQLLIANDEYHGLWIEMKSKKGKVQPKQQLFMQMLEEQGYKCKVCFGADDAIETIKKYLGMAA